MADDDQIQDSGTDHVVIDSGTDHVVGAFVDTSSPATATNGIIGCRLTGIIGG
jgi:hypothetical protein